MNPILHIVHRLAISTRSFVLGEKEWAFECPHPPDIVMGRIRSGLCDAGPFSNTGPFTKDWPNAPDDRVVYGSTDGNSLQITYERMLPFSLWDLIYFLMPGDAQFYFDGRIEPHPKGCGILGKYRQNGFGRVIRLVMAMIWCVAATSVYIELINLAHMHSIVERWSEFTIVVKTMLGIAAVLPMLFFTVLIWAWQGVHDNQLHAREVVYEFLGDKARAG